MYFVDQKSLKSYFLILPFHHKNNREKKLSIRKKSRYTIGDATFSTCQALSFIYDGSIPIHQSIRSQSYVLF